MADANTVTPALATLGGSGWVVPQPTPYVGGNQAAPYTWATKPAANAVPAGTVIRITDVGIGPGICLCSDGANWGPAGVQILARSSVALVCPADTTEDVLATFTIPAGMMGANGMLRMRSSWSCASSANNKIFRLRFGGASGTQVLSSVQTAVTTVSDTSVIANRGAASSQISDSISVASTGAVNPRTQALAVDTSVATTLVATAQKALGSEAMALESYLLEWVG